MMKKPVLSTSLSLFILFSSNAFATNIQANKNGTGQVLVSIDNTQITRGQLKKALTSSPFYTQFNTLGENVQASIRGDLLKRLVASRLLAVEAQRLKLDQTAAFKSEITNYANGLLYRQYTSALKHNITLSEPEIRDLRKQFKDNRDAFTAAKSALKASKYKALLKLTLLKLRESLHIKLYEDRINPQITPDTVLMEGDKGLKIIYSDLVDASQYPQLPDKTAIQEKLYQQTEYLLILNAAKTEKLAVQPQLERYKQQLLPATLGKLKAQEWLGDKQNSQKLLRDYYDKHPKFSMVGDQWHIGQIVLKTREQAEEVQRLIKSGKSSLFQLAGKMSIDPYGKAHNGDMGWIAQGSGQPRIEQALKDLKDNELSDIIETSQGFHLITILKRKAGKKLNFESIQDKIRQRLISEKMKNYLQQLQQKHKITWHVLEKDPKKAKELVKTKSVLD